MPTLSFIDNTTLLSKCYLKKDYSEIAEHIVNNVDSLTFYVKENDAIWGYKIASNEPLTKIYGFPFYVVRFYFKNMETLHSQEQIILLDQLFRVLKQEMDSNKGYYNVRVPAHFVDVTKAFNRNMKDYIFCGGTIEKVIHDKKLNINLKEGISVLDSNEQYVKKNRDKLLDISYTSFQAYQGQYHISPITQHKAGMIYKDWMESELNENNIKNLLICEFEKTPIGFLTYRDEESMELILSGVSSQLRGLGAYKTMLSTMINRGYEQGKVSLAGTQFDNFISQNTWRSLGFEPYYSFYNFHFDRR